MLATRLVRLFKGTSRPVGVGQVRPRQRGSRISDKNLIEDALRKLMLTDDPGVSRQVQSATLVLRPLRTEERLDAERDLVTSDSKVFEGWHDRVGGKFLEAQGTEGSASWAVVGGHRVLRLYGPAFFRVDRLAGHGRSFSIAIVLQALSQEGNSQMFGGGADSNAFLSHSGPGGVLYVGTGPVIERRFELGPGSIPDAGLHEMVYVQDGPHARLYLEGSPPLSKEIGESGEWAGFEIGSSTGLGSFSGDIAEVLVYDRALSEIEAGQVRRYLHARYGSPEGCAPTDGENAGRGDG